MKAEPEIKRQFWPIIMGAVILPLAGVCAFVGWRVAVTSSLVMEGRIQALVFLVLIAGLFGLMCRAVWSRKLLICWSVLKIAWSVVYVRAFSQEIGLSAASGLDDVLFVLLLGWSWLLPAILLVVFSLPVVRGQFKTPAERRETSKFEAPTKV